MSQFVLSISLVQDIVIGAVDATAAKDLVTKYSIRGFPTCKEINI